MVVGYPNTPSKVFAMEMEWAQTFGWHLVCA